MARKIIVQPNGAWWVVKRSDDSPPLVWLRTKEDASRVGRAIADSDDVLLVVLDHGRDDERVDVP